MGRILVAPDKFKGSLSATEVAARLRSGLRSANPGVEVVEFPIADGGDGTVDAAVAAGFTRETFTVSGPLGEPVDADVAVRGYLGVVELAQASGLAGCPREKQPLVASSRGTGELLLAVRNRGCRRIILGLGGSASTDGGAGMAQALGVRLRDDEGRDLAPGGAALRDLDSVDTAGVVRDWRGVDVIIATDVDNPLLGPTGAAAMYGPQKGATPADIEVLEAGLQRLMEVVERDTRFEQAETPGAGAAGGVGYAALCLLNSRVVPGIELLLDLLDFSGHLAGTDLVITGEGRLDAQTLRGKAPAGVARRARDAGVPAVAVTGSCDLLESELAAAGISRVYRLSDLEPDTDVSMRTAGELLERIGASIDVPVPDEPSDDSAHPDLSPEPG